MKEKNCQNLLTIIKKKKIKINKIFCYLENREGVINLIKNTGMSENLIFSLYKSNNDTYYDIYKYLNVFYRTRIEYTDDRISYDLYTLKTDFNNIFFRNNIELIFKKMFGSKIVIEKINDDAFPNKMYEYHCLVADDDFLDYLSHLMFKKIDVIIDALDIVLKVNKMNKTEAKFTIAMDPVVFPLPQTCDKKIFGEKTICFCDIWNIKENEFDDDIDELENMMIECPACVNYYISHFLLYVFFNRVMETIKNAHAIFHLDWSIRPVKRDMDEYYEKYYPELFYSLS